MDNEINENKKTKKFKGELIGCIATFLYIYIVSLPSILGDEYWYNIVEADIGDLEIDFINIYHVVDLAYPITILYFITAIIIHSLALANNTKISVFIQSISIFATCAFLYVQEPLDMKISFSQEKGTIQTTTYGLFEDEYKKTILLDKPYEITIRENELVDYSTYSMYIMKDDTEVHLAPIHHFKDLGAACFVAINLDKIMDTSNIHLDDASHKMCKF